MTPTTGNKRRAYVVDASTYTWLAGEQNNSVNLNGNLIDISDKSTDWQKWIAGVKGGTISITVFTDNESSAEQKKFLNALKSGTLVNIFIGELAEGNNPSPGYTAEALVSSITETNNNGEVSSRDLQLTINGEPGIL